MSRQQIIEEIQQLDEQSLSKVSEVLTQIEASRATKQKSLEELAGAWADMDEELYQDLTSGWYRHQHGDIISKGTE